VLEVDRVHRLHVKPELTEVAEAEAGNVATEHAVEGLGGGRQG
jgi:hypothetical protein